jgi:hypothetical protein
MINPNYATYLYVNGVTERGNALLVDTGHGREYVPQSAVLAWVRQGRIIMACPDWVMEQKPAFSKCERFEDDRPYDFMVAEAELLPYWIYPSVMRGRPMGAKV